MKEFEISVNWECIGSFKVRAETLEEAISIVENADEGPYSGLPSDSEYVDDSFKVERDCCYEVDSSEHLE